MSYFINQYTPLAISKEGLKAISSKGIQPFLDASCRREPDFESEYPSICSSCRGRNFAPRIREDDIIAYTTASFSWARGEAPCRRLVALLVVKKSFLSTPNMNGLALHKEAEKWYSENSLPPPSNCFVEGNPPKPLDETDKGGGWSSVNVWSKWYEDNRITTNGDFHVCEKVFCDLITPPRFNDINLMDWFGKIPGTRNPGNLNAEHYIKFLKWLLNEVKDISVAKRVKELIQSIT